MTVQSEKRTPSVLLIFLTCLYGAAFFVSFRSLAYGEPGGFPVFYSIGKLARWNVSELYNQSMQNAFHPLNGGVGYFFHLPYEVVLYVPISYLPQVTAYAIWSLISLFCLLFSAILLRRHFPQFDLLIPFAFAPTLSLLVNGQDGAILVLLTAISLDRFLRGKDAYAGAVLAVGLFKYPFILPMIVLLGLRHRRVLLGFCMAAIPLLTLSAALIGRNGIIQYLALTHATDAKEDPGILTNLRGIVGVCSGSLHPALVIAVSVAIVALTGFFVAGRVQVFCVGVLVTQLVSWHGHLYDAVLLIIPLAWMYRSNEKFLRWWALALIVTTPILMMRQPLGYLLAIAVFGLVGFIWISQYLGTC